MFPIYRIQMEHADPVETRTFHNKMFHTEAEAATYFVENEQKYRDNTVVLAGEVDPSEFRFVTALSHRETWCMEWFSHYTFRDRFEHPGEVLADFEQYVNRMGRLQGSNSLASVKVIEDYEAHTGNKWICLMGAEDRWRWAGQGPDTRPPCDCDHCKKAGVWRISH